MIIKNAQLFFAKLDPARPSAKYNKKNPTWELQIRTDDKEIKAEWMAAGLNVKPVVPDIGEPYFRVNLRKKSIKEDGEKSSPVDVVNASLDPVDPRSIGNGSIGNVRVFQYEYQKETGGIGIASVLMGVQLLKHLVYTPRARDDDFQDCGETETFAPDDDIQF
jgi:hypothetical protein